MSAFDGSPEEWGRKHGLVEIDVEAPAPPKRRSGKPSAAASAEESRPKQADILIDLARAAQLFHTEDDTGYADINVNGHRETWPIRSSGFKQWLRHGFFELTGHAPNSDAMQAALGVIEAKAHFDAGLQAVHVRIGERPGRIYLDLCDDDWRVVEIDAQGWRITQEPPPIRFRRAAGMRALPEPESSDRSLPLQALLNIKSEDDFVLAVAWLLACFRERGPYPLLVFMGEQGSGKSSAAAMLRALVDPCCAPLRSMPRTDYELLIAANNSWLVVLDNVSGLPVWLSDALCRLSTGGGLMVRKLYTDQEEVLLEATRPVVITGITDIISRPDLASRTVFLRLKPVPEKGCLSERELWGKFEAERPYILGALLDAVSHGLAMLPQIKLDKLPRMADFALWATACEEALWPAGTFERAYSNNRAEAVESVLDADPVAVALRSEMTGRTWSGTASELLSVLTSAVDERVAKSKAWPTTARVLSSQLQRLAPYLRKSGLQIEFQREGGTGRRIIQIGI
jgi:hypothetical protein